MRRIARADKNQEEIVKALRAAGCSVMVTSRLGLSFPDICVGYRSANYLLEVKRPGRERHDKEHTEAQESWRERWRGQVAVVTTVAEALYAVGAIK